MSQSTNKLKRAGIFIIFAAVLTSFWLLFFKTGTVVSEAMSPACPRGSTYLVMMRVLPLKSGQIIVYTNNKDSSLAYFSRIAGAPGDKIRMENDNFYVNGSLVAPASNDIVPNRMWRDLGALGVDLVLQPRTYFILSDNKSHIDSRELGLIKEGDIIGQVLFCR